MRATSNQVEQIFVKKTWQKSHLYNRERKIALSKKACNKIVGSISRYSNISKEALKEEVYSFRFQGITIEQEALLNTQIPIYVSLLTNKKTGFQHVDFVENLVEILKVISKLILEDKGFTTTIITVGLGATTDLPSIRLASYIIPAVRTLNMIYEKGITPPRVRVFKTSHTGIYVNDLDERLTVKNSSITLYFLNAFIEKFYPHLSKYFIFEDDNKYSNLPIYKMIEEISQSLTSLSEIRTEVNSIKKMGLKHGGAQGKINSLFYAAAHPFYNQAIIPLKYPNHILDSLSFHPDLIIDHGGRPQAIFNSIIKELRTKLTPSEYKFPALINLITTCGKVPVYYNASKGDFLLSDNISTFSMKKIDPMTEGDYKMIFEEVTDFEYLKFVREFQSQYITSLK